MGEAVPGAFCWIELGTTDLASARSFYTKLFGWTLQESPEYTVFVSGGQPAAGGYLLRPDQRAEGVPPHWLLYVRVSDADVAAARAGQLGARIRVPVFDAMGQGRMAVIKDPAGAVFAIWQPLAHPGFSAQGAGAFCWADLSTPDPTRAGVFYGELFDWKLWFAPNDPAGYAHISIGGHPIGGMLPASARTPNTPPHWLIWIAVADCDATVAAAAAAGARICAGAQTMEKVGRFAVLADPQGACFGVITPASRA